MSLREVDYYYFELQLLRILLKHTYPNYFVNFLGSVELVVWMENEENMRVRHACSTLTAHL